MSEITSKKAYYENLKKQINILAKEGLSIKEISERLELDEEYISNHIQKLSDEDLMIRYLNHEPIIDKDKLYKIVHCMKKNIMLIEIACYIGCQEKEIIGMCEVFNKKKNCYYDPDFPQILKNYKQNQGTISEYDFYRRYQALIGHGFDPESKSSPVTKKRYNTLNKIYVFIDYLKKNNYNVSPEEASKLAGIPLKEIYSILQNEKYINFIQRIFGIDTLTNVNNLIESLKLERSKKAKDYTRNDNKKYFTPMKINSPKLLSFKKGFSFWIALCLEFSLPVEALAELLKIDDLENFFVVYSRELQKLLDWNSQAYHAILFLNGSSIIKEQMKENIARAKDFIIKYTMAKKNNPEYYQQLVAILEDREAKRIIASQRRFSSLSEKEKQAVVHYQIKYALTTRDIPYSRAILNNYPELQEIWHEMAQYNKEASYNFLTRHSKKASVL